MPTTTQTAQAPELKTIRAVWLAFVGAVILYAGLCFAVNGPVVAGGESSVGILRAAFLAAALTLAGVSLWWRRSFATSAASPMFLFVRETADSPPPDEATRTAMQRLTVNCVIVWALSEAIALFGLVVALLSGRPEEFVPFGGAALILLYLHRPDAWPIDRILGRAGGIQ